MTSILVAPKVMAVRGAGVNFDSAETSYVPNLVKAKISVRLNRPQQHNPMIRSNKETSLRARREAHRAQTSESDKHVVDQQVEFSF